jgi:hypothetical protein
MVDRIDGDFLSVLYRVTFNDLYNFKNIMEKVSYAQ